MHIYTFFKNVFEYNRWDNILLVIASIDSIPFSVLSTLTFLKVSTDFG